MIRILQAAEEIGMLRTVRNVFTDRLMRPPTARAPHKLETREIIPKQPYVDTYEL